jgi:hypothetical protein
VRKFLVGFEMMAEAQVSTGSVVVEESDSKPRPGECGFVSRIPSGADSSHLDDAVR